VQVAGAERRKRELESYRRDLVLAVVLTIPVFLLSMVLPRTRASDAVDAEIVHGLLAKDFVSFLLTTPVMFYTGRRFHTGAYKALRAGRANMDVLVSGGTMVAYVASVALVVVMMASAEPPLVGSASTNTSINCSVRNGSGVDDSNIILPPASGRPRGCGAADASFEATVYFDTCAMLITFIILGKFLEAGKPSQSPIVSFVLLALEVGHLRLGLEVGGC
jgi:cation transport ATPase